MWLQPLLVPPSKVGSSLILIGGEFTTLTTGSTKMLADILQYYTTQQLVHAVEYRAGYSSESSASRDLPFTLERARLRRPLFRVGAYQL